MATNPFSDPNFGADLTPQKPSNPFADPDFGKEPEPKGFLGHARDLGLSAAKSTIAVPELAVGLADIPTGGRVGKFLENKDGLIGFRPKQAKDMLGDLQTDQYKAQQQEFAQAEGVFDKAKVAIENPSLIVNPVVESVAPMLAGGVLARGAMAVAPKLAPLAAGAIGEGAIMAGSAAENIRQQTDDGLLTPEQSGLSLATGALGTLFGFAGGKIAQRLGIGDVDTWAATPQARAQIAAELAQTPSKSIPRQVIEGAATEGLLEELPQSMSEQILQNLALDREWSEGLDEAAVMGTLAGAVMGGVGAGAYGLTRPKPTTDTAPPEDGAQDDLTVDAPEAGSTEPPPAGTTASPDISAVVGQEPTAVDEQPVQKPSERMGLDPNSGPISAAAVVAVDSGASQTAQAASVAAEESDTTEQPAPTTTANENISAEVAPEENPRLTQFQQKLEALRARKQQEQALGQEAQQTTEAQQTGQEQPQATGEVAPAVTPTEAPEWNSLPVDRRISKLQSIGQWNTNTGDLNVIGKKVATRDWQSLPDVVKSAITQSPVDTNAQLPNNSAMAGNEPASPELVYGKDGSPFKSARQAELTRNRSDLKGKALDVVPVDGGFALQSKPDQENVSPENQQVSRETAALDATETVPDQAIRGQKIDEDWTEFSSESGTIGVDRADMPQVKAEHRGALANFLKARGIAGEDKTVSAAELKPTQREFSEAKVEKAKNFEGGDRAILVSSDNHVLDGHHQWIAKRDKGEDVRVIQLDAPIQTLLAEVKEFPSVQESTESAPPADQPSVEPVTAPSSQARPAPLSKAKAPSHAQAEAEVKDVGPNPERSEKAKARIASRKKPNPDKDSIIEFIAKNGGILSSYMQDITGDTKNTDIPFVGKLFTDDGTSPDDMASLLMQNNYITAPEMEDGGGVNRLYELINKELNGEKVYAIGSSAEQARLLEMEIADLETRKAQDEAEREAKYAELADQYGQEYADRAREYGDWLTGQDHDYDNEIGYYEDQIERKNEDRSAAQDYDGVRADDGKAGSEKSQTGRDQEGDGAAVDRFTVGRSLSKEQRRQVLETLTDVYRAKNNRKELRIDSSGRESYAYPYAPELFEKSDITGAGVRFYVTLPDGRIAHPTELFPDYTDSDITSEIARRESAAKLVASEAKRHTANQFDTLREAGAFWDENSKASKLQSASGKATILGQMDRMGLENDGKFIMVPDHVWAKQEYKDAFADIGWVRITRKPALELASETEAERQAREASEAKAKAEADKQARKAERAAQAEKDAKATKQAVAASVDRFELGGDVDQQLSGQSDQIGGALSANAKELNDLIAQRIKEESKISRGGLTQAQSDGINIRIAKMSDRITALRKAVQQEKDAAKASGQDGLKFSKASPDMDLQYMDAVNRGDMEEAGRMVRDAAKASGYIGSADYKMDHAAPDRRDHGLTNIKEAGIVPDDFWTMPQWYTSTPEERDAHSAVTKALASADKRRVDGRNPEGVRLMVYRAVPKDVKESLVRNGDWVTPSREYAKLEGESIPGGYRIISQSVPLKNLWWDANSIAELGYDDGQSYAYKNTKNNRKLLDAVTRDDDGNIIPLSKRFSPRSDDPRFAKSPKPTNTHTTQSLKSAMDKALSGVRTPLEKAGIVLYLSNEEANRLVGNNEAMTSDSGKIQAFVVGGKVFFVPENISKDTSVKGLMLHEIGVHLKQLGRTDKEFQSILKQLDMMRKAGNKQVIAAFNRVPKDTNPDHVLEEMASYLVEQNPNLPIVKRIIAWFRNALRALAKNLSVPERMAWVKAANALSVEDIVWMATTAVRRQAKAVNGGVKASKADFTENDALRLSGKYIDGERNLSRIIERLKTEQPRPTDHGDINSLRAQLNDIKQTLNDNGYRTTGKKIKEYKPAPSEERLMAEYDAPSDVPKDVMDYVMAKSVITQDATDAVRWGRIVDTLQDQRYPSGDITIYRAVEIGDDIRPGDWVTTSREYAEDHLARYLKGRGQILEETVNGRDVLVSPTGNYEEAIYAPRSLSGPIKYTSESAKASKSQPFNESDYRPQVVSWAKEKFGDRVAPNGEMAWKNFVQFFGDSVVTEDGKAGGKPIVVYHGSTEDITTFDTTGQDGEPGAFFTTNPGSLGDYTDGDGGNVTPAYLSLTNPAEVTAKQWADGKGMSPDEAKAAGHDGYIIRGQDGGDTYIAFKPDQIKSTTNQGDFSASPDIRYSRAAPDSLEDVANRVLATPERKTIIGKIRQAIDDHRDDWALLAKQGIFDQFASIAELEKTAMGQLLDASESAYKAAAFTKNTNTVLETAMHFGAVEYVDGSIQIKPNSKGLMEILEPLADANLMREWELWAGAVRAKRLLKEGKEKNYSAKDVAFVLSNVTGDKLKTFEKVHKEWIAFNKSSLDFMEAAGLINQEQRAVWEKDDYVPFHRVSEVDETSGQHNGKGGLSGQASGIKQLTGGVEKISIVESMVRNTAHMIDASMKNVAMQRTLKFAEQQGVVESLKDARITEQEAKDRLDAMGIEYDADTLPKWREMLTGYDFRQGTVSVKIGGKSKRYVVNDPVLLRSMTSLGPTGVEGIMKILRIPKRLLTTMITSDPSFAARNFIRDTLSTWVTVHEGKRNPLTGAIKGVISSYKDSDTQRAMMAQGVGGGGFYDTSPEGARAHLDKLAGKGKTITTVGELWQAYRRVLGTTENANRIAVYEAALKRGASKAEAAYQAMDVLNFSRHGEFKAMRMLIELVPFLGSRLNGLERLYRGAKEGTTAGHQFNKSFMIKGAMITAATLALLAANWDNDDYWDLEEWERDTYYHLFVDGEHYRLPKPFEVGAIFSTIPERMFEQFRGDANTKLLGKRMLHMFLDTFALDPTPQFVKPALEVSQNKSSFTEREIVSAGMKFAAPEAQYSPYTSRTFIELADMMPDSAPEWMRSPVRLEHLFRGYLGAMGGYVLMGSDYAVREATGTPDRPAARVQDLPVAGSFIRDGVGTNKQVGRVYDMAQAVNQTYSAIKKYREEGLTEKAKELQLSKADKLKARSSLNRAVREMGEISSKMKRIYDNPVMTPEVKRIKLDELVEKRNELAKRIAERYYELF